MQSRLMYFKTSPLEQRANQATPLPGESFPEMCFPQAPRLGVRTLGVPDCSSGVCLSFLYPQARPVPGTGKGLCYRPDSGPSEAPS